MCNNPLLGKLDAAQGKKKSQLLLEHLDPAVDPALPLSTDHGLTGVEVPEIALCELILFALLALWLDDNVGVVVALPNDMQREAELEELVVGGAHELGAGELRSTTGTPRGLKEHHYSTLQEWGLMEKVGEHSATAASLSITPSLYVVPWMARNGGR